VAAATSLATLAESLLAQTTAAQEIRTLLGTTTVGTATGAAANPAALLDQFVPSSQTGTGNATAEAAGLFTAAQFTLFTAAANALLAQSTPAAANATRATAATDPAHGSVTTEAQLQSLNRSLAALGLSAADIKKVDQIASVINNFNPASFTSLIYQLEALAATASQRTVQASTANGTAVNAPAAAAQRAANSGAGNATAATVASSTGGKFALQELQLQLTFANNNGETGSGHAVGVTANLTPTRTRAATA
jgi:hypothetical protein